MIFYHVSSLIQEGMELSRYSKNNRCFCEYASNCYATCYSEFLKYYNEYKAYDINRITGRDESKWICETIFESVRKEKYCNMPSRIWGIYLSSTLDEAKEFRDKYRDPSKAHIYEIEIPDSIKVCSFDMDKFTLADEIIRKNGFDIESYKNAIEHANEYWSRGSIGVQNEYLVDCTVVVGELID